MAKQDANPSEWKPEMSDGCTWVPDWLPFVGDMTDCCVEHDRAYYYGGGEEEFQEANKNFFRCIRSNKSCWLCYQIRKAVAYWRWRSVRVLGRPLFNWEGPGLP